MDELTITGVKPTPNFASKVPRFKEKIKSNQNLGPGRYVPSDTWIKEPKRHPRTEFRPVEWQRTPNPPSIPSHDNVFGYEETKTGDLKRQKNPEKVISGIKQDRVGPGHYNLPDSLNRKGTVKWKKNKHGRFNGSQTGKNVNIGPGHYKIAEFGISN